MLEVLLKALVPIFFVMALGYFAGRRRTIDNHHVREINALVMDFALPASLFVATASTARREMMAQGPLFAIQGAVMLVVYLLWYLFQCRVLTTSRGQAAVQALTVALPNYAAAGLPLVSAILGPKETVQVAVTIAAGSIVPTPITLLLLELSGSSGQNNGESSAVRMRRALVRSLIKPIILAPVLGSLLSLSGFKLGAVADASLQLIGQAAGGVALFLTGLILSAQPFRLDWTVAGATVTGNVIRPLLAVAIVHFFPVASEIAKVSILLAALPSGFFGILFGLNYRVDPAEAGSMVIASTVFSIVTLAIAIAMLYPQ
jgi:malonate transporter and related proteins